MKVLNIIATFACLLLVHAEPPPPQSNYLPPSSSYGPPGFGGGQHPGQGAPRSGGFGRALSTQYGPPTGGSSFNKPQPIYGVPMAGNQGGNGGYARGGGHEEQSEPAHYNFEYMVQDYQSGNDFGHMEQREGDLTNGKYYVLLPDGRKQIVTYEADKNGYRPKITYEGTANNNGGGYDSNAQQRGHGSGSGGSNGNGHFAGY